MVYLNLRISKIPLLLFLQHLCNWTTETDQLKFSENSKKKALGNSFIGIVYMIWYESLRTTIQTNNIPRFLLIIQYYAEEYKYLSPFCTIQMTDHLALLEAPLTQVSLECQLGWGFSLMGFSTFNQPWPQRGKKQADLLFSFSESLPKKINWFIIMQMEGLVQRTVYLMGNVNIFY